MFARNKFQRAALQGAITEVVRNAFVIGLLSMTLSACGSGGDGGGASIPSGSSGGSAGNTDGASDGGGAGHSGNTTPSSGLQPVVYLADQDTYQIDELYLTIPGSPGNTVKLNAPLVQGGWVDDFRISPAGNAVVYMADQYILGRFELFIVNMNNPGVSTRLNPALKPNRDVMDFVISPDGSKVAYRADADADDIYELYLVSVAQPGQATKMNGTLAPNGYVRSGYSFSPDGSKLLYRADGTATDVIELFVVDVNTPGQSQKVNPPLVDEGDVYGQFRWTPDGTKIVYIADQATNDQLELFVVSMNSLGQATKLNGAMIPQGDLCNFAIAPNSDRVAYCADQDTDGVIELYTVAFAAPGQSTKLNPPLPAGGRVNADYGFSQDASFVIYTAEQDAAGLDELYRVDIANPGAAVKLNPPLVAGGDVGRFALNQDGRRVAYMAAQDDASVWEVYEVDLAQSGAPTKLSAPMNFDGVYWFEYADNGTRIVYLADQDSDGAELYDVDLAAPGVATKLNGTLVTGGEVWAFEVIP
jgi:Tol biopolymer transport system component